jgi:hypothetical protein
VGEERDRVVERERWGVGKRIGGILENGRDGKWEKGRCKKWKKEREGVGERNEVRVEKERRVGNLREEREEGNKGG